MKRFLLFLVMISLCMGFVSLFGCSSVGVEVWERDILAKTEMQLDSKALDRALDEHIYFSKEASSGGGGFGGGGCGCN
jgi:hypothetical protein